MAKKNENKEEKGEEVLKTGVLPLEAEFSNGDLNVLRNKLNEVIAELNSK